MYKTKINLSTVLILGTGLTLALFSGCATSGPTVASHPDSAADYAGYKTFMMLRPATAANAAATPALVRAARQETEAAFAAKGLSKATDAYADLLVLVHGGVADKVEVQDWGLNYGRFGRGFAGRQEVSQSRQGSLFIDVFDAKTRELVWRGSVVAELDGTPTAAQVQAAVGAIVARYPH